MASLSFSDQERVNRLAIRHRLVESQRTDHIEKIADSLISIHASDPATVYLSFAARMKQPRSAKISKALVQQRSLIRHHAMRRTMWVMTRPIGRLAHGAATAKLAQKSRADILKAIDNTLNIKNANQWYDRATKRIKDFLLSEGPTTAREIGKALPRLAVPLQFGSEKNPATLNAHTKILQGGGFEGTFVRGETAGDWISAEFQWAETLDWLGEPISGLTEEESAKEILRPWLQQFGPATLEDIRWWFGWTATLAKKSLTAIEAEPVQLSNDTQGWINADDIQMTETPDPWVRLLPGLDATTMGWKSRNWYLTPAQARDLFDQFGNAGPTIWADGRVVGSWIQRRDGSLAYRLHAQLDRKHEKLLNEAIEQFREFAGGIVVRPRFPARIQSQLLK